MLYVRYLVMRPRFSRFRLGIVWHPIWPRALNVMFGNLRVRPLQRTQRREQFNSHWVDSTSGDDDTLRNEKG